MALVLAGYEPARSPSSTLFMRAYGPQNLGIMLAAAPLALTLILWAYNALLSRLGARRTLLATSLAASAGLAACQPWLQSDAPGAPIFLYVLRQAYIVILLEQYWSFLDSRLDPERAKRLDGIVAGVGSLGGILGGMLVGSLARKLGTSHMVLIAAASILPAAALADRAYAACGEPAPEAGDKARPHALGFRSLTSEPVLVRVLLVVAATQAFAALMNLRFYSELYRAMPSVDAQTSLSGFFFAALNAFTLILQFVLTPLAASRLPLGLIQILIPGFHLAAALVVIAHPTLAACAGGYLLFKALDYSLFRVSKELMYMPFPFDARYRAKELIDVLVYRMGKGGAALAFGLLQRGGLLTLAAFSWAAAGVALAWMGLALSLDRAWRISRNLIK